MNLTIKFLLYILQMLILICKIIAKDNTVEKLHYNKNILNSKWEGKDIRTNTHQQPNGTDRKQNSKTILVYLYQYWVIALNINGLTIPIKRSSECIKIRPSHMLFTKDTIYIECHR